MLSKWLPWDFAKNQGTLLEKGKFGVYCFSCFDPYLERLFLKKIPKSFFEGDSLHTLVGPDLTIEWIENNLLTLDLFGTNDSYLVLNSDSIPQDTKTYLLEKDLDLGERFLILSFSGASKFFDKVSKKDEFKGLKVEPPRFWESGKLLSFLCDEMRVRMPHQIENLIIESVPNTVGEFIHALKVVSLNFPEKNKMTLENVRELIVPGRLDQFALASMIGQKKKNLFYKKLIDLDLDFDGYRGFFAFMQGHFLKMDDTSYIAKKSKPSKYDREIQAHSKLWDSEGLRSELRVMGELEILAKMKSPGLQQMMKEIYITSFS